MYLDNFAQDEDAAGQVRIMATSFTMLFPSMYAASMIYGVGGWWRTAVTIAGTRPFVGLARRLGEVEGDWYKLHILAEGRCEDDQSAADTAGE